MDLRSKSVFIVGGGCFGLSSALWLAQSEERPRKITVLDRFDDPPSPDAASSDLNKIIRAAYGSDLYTDLALEAIEAWNTPFWKPYYHESGVVFLCWERETRTTFIEQTFATQQRLHREGRADPPIELASAKDVEALLPESVKLPEGTSGYRIVKAGWGSARRSMEALAAKVKELGVDFVTGTAISIDDEPSPTVTLEDGRTFSADIVIVASGSWTTKLLPELSRDGTLTATGQVLATIQLTPEEAARYNSMPVILSTSTGYYIFPPNEEGVVKCAIHGPGYIRTDASGVTAPRTSHYVGNAHDQIPQDGLEMLFSETKRLLPELGARGFDSSRNCWYQETVDGDFLVDWHPTKRGVLLATGGSGHAYKFTPTIGRWVLSRLLGTLETELAENFSAKRKRQAPQGVSLSGYNSVRKTFDETKMARA